MNSKTGIVFLYVLALGVMAAGVANLKFISWWWVVAVGVCYGLLLWCVRRFAADETIRRHAVYLWGKTWRFVSAYAGLSVAYLLLPVLFGALDGVYWRLYNEPFAFGTSWWGFIRLIISVSLIVLHIWFLVALWRGRKLNARPNPKTDESPPPRR